ncbi:MAG: glycoside hydrolase family 3 N-terminal domain-containing protein [Bacteriovoracaceae bacterium]
MLKLLSLFGLIGLAFILTYELEAASWPVPESVIKKNPLIEAKVKEILNSMTIEEKVAQMIQAEIKHIKPEDLKTYPLGSILNGGGSFPNNNKFSKAADWVALADSYYNSSIQSGKGIPLIWGTDAVHGHNNLVGATLFPHNIGLGATNNEKLIEEIGKATALEVLSTGVDWIFAPTVAVVRNDRWGRAYEGYSEDPLIVKKYAEHMIYGIQGKSNNILNENHLLATAKHFIGDGGTVDGIDQGNNTSSEDELIRLHAQGYVSALSAGAQTVMASFNSWNGIKVHGYKYLLTDVLKEKMNFDGFVIGDWNGHGQIPGCRNDSCAQAINAGVDMLMAPEDWKKLFYNTLEQVKNGEIKKSRIDDAVSRILRVKIRYGLFELSSPSFRKHAGSEKYIGSPEHRSIARQAVRESLVLLKNKNNILPLQAQSKILVTGSGADNIGKQNGGWTLSWQGTGNSNADFPGATSIFSGIKQATLLGGGQAILSLNGEFQSRPDVAIVVFGEDPYAEGQGDIKNLYYGERYPDDLKLIQKLKSQNIPVISIFLTGRPLWINPELNASDALVVAWLPGSEGAGVSDVLIRKPDGSINFDIKGKLSFSWPLHANQVTLNKDDLDYKPLFPYGYGLTFYDTDNLTDNLSENPFPAGNSTDPRNELLIFNGRPTSMFRTFVTDEAGMKKELLGGIGESTNKTVKSIAVDRLIQEDSRQLSFDGKGAGAYFFESIDLLDISSFTESNGALTFYLRRDNEAQGPIELSMNTSTLDLEHFVNKDKINQWQEVIIPLQCFTKIGLDPSNIKTIFSLSTNGQTKVSVSLIKIISKSNFSACSH